MIRNSAQLPLQDGQRMVENERQDLPDQPRTRQAPSSDSAQSRGRRYSGEREADLVRLEEKVDSLLLALRDLVARKPASAAPGTDRPHHNLAEAAEDFIFVVDLAGKIDYVNQSTATLMSATPEQLLGQSFDTFSLLPPSEEAAELLARVVLQEEVVRYETTLYLSSGGRNFYATLSPIKDAEGGITAILGMAKDVSDLARARDELRSLSLVDELTGVYNRRGFLSLATQHLSLAQRNGGRVCLIMVDVDGLKEINDRFGHHQGDAALVALASILKENCRRSDVVARIGGDEFVLLAPSISEGGTSFLLARLHRALEAESQRNPRPHRFSASIGAVECQPDPGYTIDRLLNEADRKMYEAKRVGPG
jgi:diguanylate cyclase (GGDEF)-like protein/PAS domain S-box-containing protein